MASERIEHLDAFKGMLICSVVLGHALQCRLADFEGNLLMHAIYSCHMAAFMAVSGFCAYRGGGGVDIRRLLRPLRRLLVPFFAWFFIGWLLFSRANLFSGLLGLLRQPDGGLWFLYTLAACHLLLFLLRLIPIGETFSIAGGVAILSCIEVATGWNSYGFHFIAWYFIFFAGGYLARRYAPKVDVSRNAAFPACCLALWLVLLPWWRRNTPVSLPVIGELPGLASFAYRFAAALLGVSGFWLLFRRMLPGGRLMGMLCVLGRETLGIYAVHGLVLAGVALAVPAGSSPAEAPTQAHGFFLKIPFD